MDMSIYFHKQYPLYKNLKDIIASSSIFARIEQIFFRWTLKIVCIDLVSDQLYTRLLLLGRLTFLPAIYNK